MKQIILPVTIHLNIRLPLALLQPESADAPTGPEPEAHACQGCGNCGGCGKCQHEKKQPVREKGVNPCVIKIKDRRSGPKGCYKLEFIYVFANTPSDAVLYASDELFSVAFPFKLPWSFADTPMLPIQRAERS